MNIYNLRYRLTPDSPNWVPVCARGTSLANALDRLLTALDTIYKLDGEAQDLVEAEEGLVL
jgi:hypothetical protein